MKKQTVTVYHDNDLNELQVSVDNRMFFTVPICDAYKGALRKAGERLAGLKNFSWKDPVYMEDTYAQHMAGSSYFSIVRGFSDARNRKKAA